MNCEFTELLGYKCPILLSLRFLTDAHGVSFDSPGHKQPAGILRPPVLPTSPPLLRSPPRLPPSPLRSPPLMTLVSSARNNSVLSVGVARPGGDGLRHLSHGFG